MADFNPDALAVHRLGLRQYRATRGDTPTTRTGEELWQAFSAPAPIRTHFHGRHEGGHTSGIPIYGERADIERTGWSSAHVHIRNKMTTGLRRAEGRAFGIRAENSHALGHGDFGVDHYLSAPPASQFQNTAQLAFETAMRTATAEINQDLPGGEDISRASMVRLKVTDTLDEQGMLNVRRYQVIRRLNSRVDWGNEGNEHLAVDYLMDGRRLGITEEETNHIQQSVYHAMTGADTFSNIEADQRGDSWRTGGVAAPRGQQLRDHMERLRTDYTSTGEVNRNPDAINPFGPAFTSVTIDGHAYAKEDNPHLILQDRLNTVHGDSGPLDWNSNVNWEQDPIGRAERRTDAASREYLRATQAAEATFPGDKRTRLLDGFDNLERGTREQQWALQDLQAARADFHRQTEHYKAITDDDYQREEIWGEPALQRQLSDAIAQSKQLGRGVKRKR